ncbi:MAG: hypothetical protein IKC71_05250 [Clostridia bacterium]|nr:hypothetical protein [Clostridia bacterium]
MSNYKQRNSFTKNKKTVVRKSVSKHDNLSSIKQSSKKPFSLSCGVFEILGNKIYKKDDKKRHTYIVYYDNNNFVDKVVETTHYVDPKVSKKIKAKEARVFQLSGEHFPTTVNRSYYTKDIDGKSFNLKDFKLKNSRVRTCDVENIYFFADNKRR